MAEKTSIRNTDVKKPRGGSFKKGHPPPKTAFKKGYDPRRHTAGQRNKAAVQLTKTIRDILVEIGQEELTVRAKGIQVVKKKVEWLGQKIWSEALGGNMAAITIILERTEGKITQPIGFSGDIAGVFRVIYDKDAEKK